MNLFNIVLNETEIDNVYMYVSTSYKTSDIKSAIVYIQNNWKDNGSLMNYLSTRNNTLKLAAVDNPLTVLITQLNLDEWRLDNDKPTEILKFSGKVE